MDDNVTPHLTMRLVDALIAADKDFGLLIVPGAEHTMYRHKSYWLRRCRDFLVQHLQGLERPPYRLAEVPPDLELVTQMIAEGTAT